MALVRVAWRRGAKLPARVRERAERLLAGMARDLDELEAVLDDLHRMTADGKEWMLPRVEVTLPIFEERCSLRVRIQRLDDTRISISTRSGRLVGEVVLE